MADAPVAILDLVTLFSDNYDDYKKSTFNETQLRRQFIDPMFEQLGWDISNKQGYAEQFKQVVHEESPRDEGRHKAPDYSFRVGREKKFFVQAKKPAVELDKDKAAAYQLRRYGWSAGLPLSILTNFEELLVYDTRIKPEKDDSPKIARILYFRFDSYEKRWNEIEGLLSWNAVIKGAFDRFASEKSPKKGTAAVDQDFLETIERWRVELSVEIFASNKNLDEEELSSAVQSLIDRILFLRICEDKGIEKYGNLKEVTKKGHSYKQLRVKFGDAQERYNSGLFHVFREGATDATFDSISEGLVVPDKVLNSLIEDVYFLKSPYEFSVISPEILGSVYERFLGSAISIQHGKVIVDLKPEPKKAGGVYYTPNHVAEYMVKAAVDGLLSAQGSNDLPKFRVLDMACGSGSFLIQVYDYLLVRFRNWHIARGSKSTKYLERVQLPDVSQAEKRLKFSERRPILLEHVFGVDIDSQAVEVTKLSLFLKLIEDTLVIPAQLELSPFQKRLLPDMASNIKCGNSIVSPEVVQSTILTTGEVEHLKPFDWYAETGFRSIMSQGGFDVIIGNPPYSYRKSTVDKFKGYYTETYESTQGNFDTYKMFLERGVKLLNVGGRLCQIVNSSFLIQPQFVKLRTFLDRELDFQEIDVLGSNVFAGVTIDTAILCGSRKKRGSKATLIIREPENPKLLKAAAPPKDFSIAVPK